MQHTWEQGSTIQLGWDPQTRPPREAVSLSLLGRWSWPFFHTSPHVQPSLPSNDSVGKILYLPKKISEDVMTQASSLKGWDKYSCWQVERWQGCTYRDKATTFGKRNELSHRMELPLSSSCSLDPRLMERDWKSLITSKLSLMYTGHFSASG